MDSKFLLSGYHQKGNESEYIIDETLSKVDPYICGMDIYRSQKTVNSRTKYIKKETCSLPSDSR